MSPTANALALRSDDALARDDARSPAWLDRAMLPYRSRTIDLPAGTMHYLDEGTGPAVLLVHGTPTWSFMYRHVIARLSRRFRCIAPDHLGFGLSDKPAGFGYTPAEHAQNLERLVSQLGLTDFVLVVHDFGGPIGLPLALQRPERLRGLVVCNTWMWSNEGHAGARRLSRLVASPLGVFLYRYLNFAPRVVLPAAFADRKLLTPAVKRHYAGPFALRRERTAPWVLGRELYGSNEYYASLWEQRAALARVPMRLAWAERDVAFKAPDLARWQQACPHAPTLRAPESGHFIAEEAPDVVARAVEELSP